MQEKPRLEHRRLLSEAPVSVKTSSLRRYSNRLLAVVSLVYRQCRQQKLAAGGVNFAAIGPDGKVAAGTGTYATGRDAAGRPTIVGHTKLDYGALKTSEGTPYAVTRETSTNAPGVAVEQITVAGEGTGTIVTRERDWTDDKLRNAAYSISQLGNEVAPEQYVRLERAHGLRHGVAQEMHRNYQSSLASGMGQAEALETMQRSIRNMQGRQVETTIGNVRLQDNPSSGIYGVQKSEVESAVAEIASKTDVNRVRSEGAAYLKSIGVDDTTAKMFIESLQKVIYCHLGRRLLRRKLIRKVLQNLYITIPQLIVNHI